MKGRRASWLKVLGPSLTIRQNVAVHRGRLRLLVYTCSSGVCAVSTVKKLGCLLFGCVVSSVAWGQFDTPPDMPDFSKPSSTKTELRFPNLPDTPKVATPTSAVRTPTVVAARPQRLSAESTANLPKRVQNIIDFYGGVTSGRALAALPTRPTTGSTRNAVPQQFRKPFEGALATMPPTISPYMNLYVEEGVEGLPNYHAFVRPVQRQMQTNAAARRRINSLQNQVQQVSYGEAVPQSSGSIPGTGHGTRYFNTTQFYQPTRRLR